MAGKFETKKVRVKATQQKKKKNKFKRFMRRAAKDKRYRAVFCVLMLIITGAMGRLYQSRKDKAYYTSLLEQQRNELVEDYESQLATQRENYEIQMGQMKLEYEATTPEDKMREEAEYIAKVLYGNARDNSERDQRTLVWCVLNRVDSSSYPNTIKGVCEQEKQWMGYSDNNPVLQSLYEIAYNELETYYNGYRPVNADYIYMSWSSKEIVLRDTFEVTKNTRYWQAG